jgi:putative heme-binding domain-containing protein
MVVAAPEEHEHGEVAEKAKVEVPKIFLDKNPRIVQYQLRRLTNLQLLNVPRQTDHRKYVPVYEAILSRKGFLHQHRAEAVDALAKLKKSAPVAEIVAALRRLDEDGSADGSVLHDLAHMLMMLMPKELAASRESLGELATGAQKNVVQQVAFAGLVTIDGSVDNAWRLASEQGSSAANLVACLPMLHHAKLRVGFRPKLLEVINEPPDDETLAAAIDVITHIPGNEMETFSLLAEFVRSGIAREVAVRSIRRIAPDKWPTKELESLAASVLEHVKSTPESERTRPGALDAVELGYSLASRLPKEKGGALRKALSSLGVRVILLRTIAHQMRYDKTHFAVEAGRPVELVLANPDIMPHNLVITAPGALEEIGTIAELMQPETKPGEKAFVPNSPLVLFSTRLVQSDESVKLNFTAPKEPGDYPFVCTFPGHWRRMYGVMVVVEDLDAWLENPVAPPDPLGNTRVFVEEWNVKKFADEIARAKLIADASEGAKLMEEAGCMSCHLAGAKGGKIGPDLNDVFTRWKGDRAGVLTEILEPGKKVDEKYRLQLLQLASGSTMTGLVTKESAESVTIITNPQNPVPQDVAAEKIILRVKTESTMMPLGLLNRFTKSEVLSILAYIEGLSESAKK